MSRGTPTLQRRSQFHAYWGSYSDASSLPNASGNPLVALHALLESGDWAYSQADETLFVCTDSGFAGGGDAVWDALATGSTTIRDAHEIVVGSSASPYNDTSDDADFLDPGDGSGIAAALSEASTRGYPLDVRLRPMQTNLDAANLPLAVPSNVRLIGAGSQGEAESSLTQATILQGPTTGEQTILELQQGAQLESLHVVSPAPTGSTSSSRNAVIFCLSAGEQRIVDVTGEQNGSTDRTALNFLTVDIGDGVVIRQCRFDVEDAQVDTGNRSRCIRIEEHSQVLRSPTQVIECVLKNADTGVQSLTDNVQVLACTITATINGVRIFPQVPAGGDPWRGILVADCDIRLNTGVDPLVDHHGIRLNSNSTEIIEHARIVDNYIFLQQTSTTTEGISVAGDERGPIINGNAVDAGNFAGSTGLLIGAGVTDAIATSNYLKRAATPLSDSGTNTIVGGAQTNQV